MNAQQIQAEKLDLIGWIYSLQDISIIEKLKSIQSSIDIDIDIDKYEHSLKPMSTKELINRAKEANKAISNNDVITQGELEKEIKNW